MTAILTTILTLTLLLVADGAAGQGSGLAGQSLRPYGHVFVAYALAWALILGWVVSLARRWRSVQEELEDGAPDGP